MTTNVGPKRDNPFSFKQFRPNTKKRSVGVVEEGALADLLLVNGDPLANIKLITDPDKNLLVIMKDGRVHKNLVTPGAAH